MEPTVQQTATAIPRMIPLAMLREAPYNARETFDATELQSLASSLKVHGIQQPLLVRPMQDGAFEIVFGSRRSRAAKLVPLIEVPCFVNTLSDDDAMELNLIENIQRKDINAFEQAKGFRRLLDLPPVEGRKKHTIETLAKAMGNKSKEWVYQQLQLLKLDPMVAERIQAGTLSMSHGSELTRIKAPMQKEALRDLDMVSGNGNDPPSVAYLRDWIKRNAWQDMRQAIFDKTDATLVPAAGACIKCEKYSAVNQELLKECGGPHTCTDRVCHDGKHWAHLFRLRNAMIAKLATQKPIGPALVMISKTYGSEATPKGVTVLPRDKYSAAGQKVCPDTRTGFVAWVYRGNEKELGKGELVCINLGKCKVHTGGVPAHSVDQPGRRINQREASLLAERDADIAALRAAIRARRPDDRFLLTAATLEWLSLCARSDRCAFEKNYKGLRVGSDTATLAGWLNKQTPAVQRQILVDSFLYAEFNRLPELKDAAKRLHLDPDKIVAAARLAAAAAPGAAIATKPVQASTKAAAGKSKPKAKPTKKAHVSRLSSRKPARKGGAK